MRILLVEDHPATRQSIVGLLESFGHELQACPDAASAWAAYRDGGHEVVLLDLGLPDMSGIEFCRQIRAEPGGDVTGVLVVTGSDHPEDLRAALEAGADDYVSKPVDADLLRVRLTVIELLIRSRADRLRVEAELRKRFSDLSAVHNLTAAASRPLPLEEVYEEVLDALELAFRTRRAAILLRDPEGELGFAAWHGLSEAYRRSAAFSPRTFRGPEHPVPLLVPSVDREPALAPLDEANRSEGIRAMAYVPLVYDDRVLGEMVLYHGAPHRFTEDEVRLAVTMATYVAFAIGRRQAESALKASEERFRQLAEHIDDIFWMSAAHRSEMVYVSPAYERICGRTRESLYRDPGSFLEAVHPDDLVLVERALEQLRSGDFPELECRILRPDGTLRWIRTRIFPIPDASGRRVVRFAGISEDATDEKQIAEQLLQSEKLSATGMFVSGIAHELNNPLTAVLGFSELLARQGEGLDPRLHRWTTQIHEQALRAKTIVEKLLTFSRQHKPVLAHRSINDILSRTLSAIEDDCRGKNVETELSLGQLPPVLADDQQLRQVFLHLFSNAIQAMATAHGGGLLRVESRVVDDHVEIRVADDGPGIAPDETRRVFDPFYTTKEVGQGVGLGLSTAFAIVKEHGGEIRAVGTEPPPGATFVVELPIASEDAELTPR